MSANIESYQSQAETFLGSLDEMYYKTEKEFLNPVGYKNGLGTVTAICGRAPLALVQGSIGIIGFSAELFMGLATLGMQGNHFDSANHCLNHIGQAGLNLGRTALEVVPMVAQAICQPYDEAGESILPYWCELKNRTVEVIVHNPPPPQPVRPSRPFRS